MLKWNEPKGAPPPWLDPAFELPRDTVTKASKFAFVVQCVESCFAIGVYPLQAAGVCANAMNESARGQSYQHWNLGGWKITKLYADDYIVQHVWPAPWWRAPGNKVPGATLTDPKGGDPPWCYYRAFESLQDYCAEWIRHFVPHPDWESPYPGYKRCGEAFWTGDPWFPLLVARGYKGQNTRQHPDGAIAEHVLLVREACTLWVQSRLVVSVDGVWGPKSQAALLSVLSAPGGAGLVPSVTDAATLGFVQAHTMPA